MRTAQRMARRTAGSGSPLAPTALRRWPRTGVRYCPMPVVDLGPRYAMVASPHTLAMASAFFSAIGTMLIQRGLQRSNFYAGFWINVTVGMIGLWTAVLLFVPRSEWDWSALPYFMFSGIVGTACGRLFRVAAIEKVGGPVAAAIGNLAPLIATGLAIVLLNEQVTFAILTGTLVIVL